MASAERSSPSMRSIGIGSLTELALDLRWSWNHGADELWAELEPEYRFFVRSFFAFASLEDSADAAARWLPVGSGR